MKITAVVRIEPTQRLLKKMRGKAADLTPAFRGPIANRVHRMFERIFATEGAYIGSRWAPLAAGTIAQKARIRRANMGILRRYNTLWASLVKRSHPLGYAIATPRSLLVGTGVPYAAPHQTGTSRMPQRVIAPSNEQVPKSERDAWELIMLQHLESVA